MGDIIDLAAHREARRRRTERRDMSRVEILFDLACPFTYLLAERADRSLREVLWTPASLATLRGTLSPVEAAGVRAAAEARAQALRLPLSWPERFPADVPAAMRVASLAAEGGRAGAFVLAASRLAFCGGYELDDPEILAEAAAAADLRLHEALAAAGEVRRDGPMERTALRLLRSGADELPVVTVGRMMFAGERRLSEAAAAAAALPPERTGGTGRPG
jgi:2-hydroxychromene-2-carboxylate isomerase